MVKDLYVQTAYLFLSLSSLLVLSPVLRTVIQQLQWNLAITDKLVHGPLSAIWRLSFIQGFCVNISTASSILADRMCSAKVLQGQYTS